MFGQLDTYSFAIAITASIYLPSLPWPGDCKEILVVEAIGLTMARFTTWKNGSEPGTPSFYEACPWKEMEDLPFFGLHFYLAEKCREFL